MASGPQADPPPSAGRDLTSDLVPGEALGRYRLLSVIQRGGMGEICLAEDTEQGGRRVVIKRLLEDFVAEEEYLKMFRDEARIMSRLRHPNIVQVLETPVLRGTLCLVMELVPGRNVGQILMETRNQALRMPPNVALHVMIEVLRGLHYAHTAVDEDGEPLGVVHRDVSPGNLLVSFGGEVKVTDFGIAKSRLSVLATSVGVMKGTTRYLSPEQIRGSPVTARSDLFACAAVLVEMLTGVALFDRGQVPPTLLAIVKGQRPPVSDLLPFRAPELCAILEQALALAPVHRPESAAAMADALETQRPALGSTVGAQEVGAYLTRLFPDRAPSKDPSEAGPLGVTYLLEVDEREVSALGGSAVQRSMSGARPLDASEFEDPDAPKRTPVRPISRPVPTFTPGAVPGASLPPEEPSGVSTEGGPARKVDFVEEVEAAARELSAAAAVPPPPPPPESEPGVSDSAVEADAFQLTAHDARQSRFSVPSFLGGVALGGAAVYLALQLFGDRPETPPAPPAPQPAETAGNEAEPEGPVLVAEPVRLVAPPPAGTATTSTTSASADAEEVDEVGSDAAGEVAYITITRPRGARVSIDGTRLGKRVPIRRHPVPAGLVRVEIHKRRFSREVELEVRPGQHLDVSRAEIRVLEEGAPEGAKDQ